MLPCQNSSSDREMKLMPLTAMKGWFFSMKVHVLRKKKLNSIVYIRNKIPD